MNTRSQKLIGVIIPNLMSQHDIDFCKNILFDNEIDDIIVLPSMSFGDALRNLKLKANFILIDRKLNDKIVFDKSLINKCIRDKNWLMTSFYKNKFELSTLQFTNQSYINYETTHEAENIGLHFCSKNLFELASWNLEWESIPDFMFGVTTSNLLKNDFVEIETLK